MSVDYSAHIVYGVSVTAADICDFRDNNEIEWEEICDEWVINPDLYEVFDAFVIGIYMDYADEGEFTELTSLSEPSEKEINDLQKVLKRLGIERNPGWFLMCRVS